MRGIRRFMLEEVTNKDAYSKTQKSKIRFRR
jgi:hypothetical protein